jgi:hypothetical protein
LAAFPAIHAAKVDDTSILKFLDQPEAQILIGRLIFPRFFGPNLDLRSANPWPAYARRNYARIGFLLLSPKGVFHAVIPVDSIPENFLPDQDVILLGCNQGDYIDVRLLVFPSGNRIFVGKPIAESCSIR